MVLPVGRCLTVVHSEPTVIFILFYCFFFNLKFLPVRFGRCYDDDFEDFVDAADEVAIDGLGPPEKNRHKVATYEISVFELFFVIK